MAAMPQSMNLEYRHRRSHIGGRLRWGKGRMNERRTGRVGLRHGCPHVGPWPPAAQAVEVDAVGAALVRCRRGAHWRRRQRLGPGHWRQADVALGEFTIQVPDGAADAILPPARQAAERHATPRCSHVARTMLGKLTRPPWTERDR